MTPLPQISPIAQCTDPFIARAMDDLAEAEYEAARWHSACISQMRILGPRIWREHHPLDLDKLYQRRRWRTRVRFLRKWLADRALLDWRAPELGS